MTRLRNLALRLQRDMAGAMAVETAVVAPVLILMSLGAFQVSELVARQNELQSAMSVAQSVALSSDPDDGTKRETLQNIVATTTGLDPEQVTVEEAYRCNAGTDYVASESNCSLGNNVSSYVKVTISDTYTPVWVEYGVGQPIELDVVRYIIFRQEKRTS